MTQSISQAMQVFNEESREMMAIWPDIVCDIMEIVENLNMPQNVAKWMKKVNHY